MGLCKPILTEISYSKEEKEQTQSEHDISDKRTKNPLPVNGTRTEAHAVNNAAQTAHISKKPCQISSSLVFAAKRDGSQKMQPASSSAINKESALNGRLSIIA
jgi:hypothetical protein